MKIWVMDIFEIPKKVNWRKKPKVSSFHREDITYPHKTKNGLGIIGRLRKKKCIKKNQN